MIPELIKNLRLDTVRPEVLLGVLIFALVMFVGVTVLAIREQRRKATTARKLEPHGPSGTSPSLKESRFVRFVERVGNYVSHGRASTTLWEQLIRAGYMSRSAPAEIKRSRGRSDSGRSLMRYDTLPGLSGMRSP